MKNIYKALAAFQQEIPAINQAKSGYGYKYADLTTIFKTINPVMKKHGLGFTQGVQGEQMHTIVFHVESGEFVETFMDIPKNVTLKSMNAYQSLGSAITYMRRYSIASMLGLVTDEDMDAKGVQETPRVPTPQKVAVTPPKPKPTLVVEMTKENAEKLLNKCTDKKQLTAAWKSLTPENKKHLEMLCKQLGEQLK